ncbi:C-terminal binding protein [Brachybacterium sp. p3-SID957]|uniref:C-terminal binding protein n=1 Tax=Brachybacterium sp. p3-SID957 TaxID=2916049 RepID=UPI00223AE9B2|nr:C-terminal binding protein [Brachybacterium sp. p3-SID957]MCT1777224.1 C-terminal binding protein [Brachybacterium sp. p3-SID957]
MTRAMRIAIVDCDNETFDEEQEVAARYGIELSRAQATDEEQVVEAAEGADGILVQYAPITASVMDALPQLRAIGRYGVGVDTVDVDAATDRGIAVCNVPDYGVEDVSDHAIALIMSVVRCTAQLDRMVRAGQYSLVPVKPLHRVSSLRLGVVGLGRIGAATAIKARALGFTVVGSDPQHEVGTQTSDGIEVVEFETVLSSCDVISLHVPLLPSTRHLIDDATIDQMKDGAMLVNTCRGGVVDTEAVARALRSGKMKGAGLDVFEHEPLPADSPLMDCPSATLTPHASWYSEQSYSELKRRVTEAVAAVIHDEQPRDLLNPAALRRD